MISGIILLLLIASTTFQSTEQSCTTVKGCTCRDGPYLSCEGSFVSYPCVERTGIQYICNDLTSPTLPESTVFSSASKLVLVYNNVKEIPSGYFDNMKNLIELEMAHFRMKSFPKKVMEKLAQLEQLSIRNMRKLISIDTEAFNGLKNLVFLAIVETGLSTLPSKLFKDQSKLIRLRLGNNKIKLLKNDQFCGLADALTILELDNNRLNNLPDHVFKNLTSLTDLDLDGNLFVNIPLYALEKLRNLERLDLGDNILTEIRKSDLNGLSNLKILELDNNKIRTLENASFSSLKSLDKLYLEKNKIAYIKKNAFKGLRKLTKLSLADNIIRVIEDKSFIDLLNLEDLDLENTNLTVIGNSMLKGLSVIKEINFRMTNITRIEPYAFKYIPNVKKIMLGSTKLSTFPTITFDTQTKLGQLDFENTALHCDCSVNQALNRLKNNANSVQITGTCQEPKHLKNMIIKNALLKNPCTSGTCMYKELIGSCDPSCDGKKYGYYQHAGDCSKYIKCNITGTFIKKCTNGIWYDKINSGLEPTCNGSNNVRKNAPLCKGMSKAAPTSKAAGTPISHYFTMFCSVSALYFIVRNGVNLFLVSVFWRN